MPIQIEIQDAHAQLLVDFYIERLKVLRGEITERELETKEINTIIQKLKRKSPQLPSQTNEPANKIAYSEKWPWIKKVQFAIEHEGKAITTKEIVDILSQYEPSFLFDRKRAVASISSILSSKSGSDKEFSKVESESGDFAYMVNNLNKKADSDSTPKAAAEDDSLPF